MTIKRINLSRNSLPSYAKITFSGLTNFTIVCSILFQFVTLNSVYVGGFLMFMVPFLNFCGTVYLIKQDKWSKSYLFPITLVTIYYLYIISIHLVHKEFFFIYGVGDIYCLLFLLMCLSYDEGEELLSISRSCLYLNLAFSILSLLTLSLPPISSPAVPEAIRDTLNRISSNGGRLVGLGANPNTTAHSVLYLLILSMIYIYTDRKVLNQVLFLFSLVLTCIILLMTNSRAAILTLALFSLLFFICYIVWIRGSVSIRTRKVIDAIIIFCILLLIIACICFALSLKFRTFMLDYFRVDVKGNQSIADSIIKSLIYSTNRSNLREQALELWHSNILFGVPTFGKIDANNNFYGSHNSFIQILSSAGIFGLVLFIIVYAYAVCGLIYDVFKRKANVSLPTLILLCAIVAMIFDNMFETYLYGNISLPTMLSYIIIASGMKRLPLPNLASSKEIDHHPKH